VSAQGVNPRISVITPCLNGALHIGDAVQSVLMQGCADVEHIVADGGSTDGTLEILRGYSHLKILSSPDHGMYDALNRALVVAGGEFIGILNCDDCYANDAFASVAEEFCDESVMAVAGDAITFRSTGHGTESVVDRLSPADADLLFRSTLGNPSINAWFFRASVFAVLGPFDTSFTVAGDREFMLRFALSGMRYAETRRLVYRYRLHGGSMTFAASGEMGEKILREHRRMSDVYLRKPGLPNRARKLIKRARTRDTLTGAIYWARQGDLGKAMSHAMAGSRHDPVWPARFAGRALREFWRKIGFRQQSGRA
jgi:glycosyltransferase involved in cell wall biosynthesis